MAWNWDKRTSGKLGMVSSEVHVLSNETILSKCLDAKFACLIHTSGLLFDNATLTH